MTDPCRLPACGEVFKLDLDLVADPVHWCLVEDDEEILRRKAPMTPTTTIETTVVTISNLSKNHLA